MGRPAIPEWRRLYSRLTANLPAAYYVTRDATARPVSDSFPEFVREIGLKNRLHEFFGWQNQEPDDWPPQTFEPYPAS